MVVVVEEVEAARTALEWAVHNVVRSGDIITLLHVFQSTETTAGSSDILEKRWTEEKRIHFPKLQKLNQTGRYGPGRVKAQNSIVTKTSRRLLRLKGFHLALSFKDLCDRVPEAKVEIVVTEGDEGPTIVSLVKRIGASALILGLHNQSFLCRILGRKGTSDYCIKNLNCRVLVVKHNKSARTGFPERARMASDIQIVRNW
eukprot:Gb_30841 [translate_table: standard]